MNKRLETQEETIPGIGVSGVVMCPIFKGACLKSGCELWVELTYGAGTSEETKVGRCAYSWTAILTTEQTEELKKIREALAKLAKADKVEDKDNNLGII